MPCLIVGLDQHDFNVLWKVLRQSLSIAEWREDLLQHAACLFYGGLFLLSCHSPLHLVEVRAFIKKVCQLIGQCNSIVFLSLALMVNEPLYSCLSIFGGVFIFILL